MRRVLIIGLDGAEPALAERWAAEGKLPALAALRERGCYMPCASVTPPVTFPAWTTCVSGVNPGRHGVFDFTRMEQGAYQLEFVNSTHRRAPALWNILSDAGKRVGVLGVPGTYPPESVNGFMVAGFDSPVCTAVDKSFVYPEGLYDDVKEWRFADFQETNIGPGWHDMALNKLLRGIDTKERIALELYDREEWDFFMVVFGESDTVSHHFWHFHDPESPRHVPDGPADAIEQVYRRLDAAVGRLVAAAGDDVTVIIVSDHGFGGSGTGVVHLNNWLAERGWLHFRNQRESMLKKAGLGIVPDALKGALFRRLSSLAAGAESKSRFGRIDWRNTVAWSEELNYFPSIRLNVWNREAGGIVEPEDYEAQRAEIIAALEAWDAVAHAWPREALFEGPYVDLAPDIIVDLALENGYSHSCLRSQGTTSFDRLPATSYHGGKEKGMAGNHRPMGVLMLSRPSHAHSATLMDIAPTVLAELKVAGPPMDGLSLLEEEQAPVLAGYRPAVSGYTAAQSDAIEDRLRQLGYLE